MYVDTINITISVGALEFTSVKTIRNHFTIEIFKYQFEQVSSLTNKSLNYKNKNLYWIRKTYINLNKLIDDSNTVWC